VHLAEYTAKHEGTCIPCHIHSTVYSLMVHIVSEMLMNSEIVRNVYTKNRIQLEDALTTMPLRPPT